MTVASANNVGPVWVYMGAYAGAVPSYTPAEAYLGQAGLRLHNLVASAGQAAASKIAAVEPSRGDLSWFPMIQLAYGGRQLSRSRPGVDG